MLDKKQIRLKTVQATNWIDPKEQLLRRSLHLPTKLSPRRTTTAQITRKLRVHTERREQEDNALKKIVFKNTQEGKVSSGGKTNLQKFPKRESVVKNGNPYRFFINSRKVLTEASEVEQQFMIKMEQAVSHISRLSQKRRTVQSCHQKNRKTSDLVFKLVRTSRAKERGEVVVHGPEPWFLKEEQESFQFD